MKIAVTSTGANLDSTVDPRFGRCAYFIILETDSMAFESVQNPNISLGGGAGIQSAQLMAEKGVQTILTGNCGPNAFQTFRAAGIQVIVGVSGSVNDVVERFRRGDFSASQEPNVASHFGMGASSNFNEEPFDSTGTGGNMGRGFGSGMGMDGGMGRGRGMGRGMGMGRGIGGVGPAKPGGYPQGTYPDPTDSKQPAAESMNREQELAVLKEQAKAVATKMREINARINTLEESPEVTALTADVDKDKCTGCLRCSSVCPTGAISVVEDIASIDQSKCNGCSQCIPLCPEGAIVLKKA